MFCSFKNLTSNIGPVLWSKSCIEYVHVKYCTLCWNTHAHIYTHCHSLCSSWAWHDCSPLSRWILNFVHKDLLRHFALQSFGCVTFRSRSCPVWFWPWSMPAVSSSARSKLPRCSFGLSCSTKVPSRVSVFHFFLQCLKPPCLWELQSICLSVEI